MGYGDRGHGLWVRVLDVPAAFAAREYRGTGSFDLRVHDRLELAGGTYGLEIIDGKARIARVAEDTGADATCGVAALGTLLTGACGVADLVAAGLLEADGPRAAAKLAGLLDIPGLPHAINGF